MFEATASCDQSHKKAFPQSVMRNQLCHKMTKVASRVRSFLEASSVTLEQVLYHSFLKHSVYGFFRMLPKSNFLPAFFPQATQMPYPLCGSGEAVLNHHGAEKGLSHMICNDLLAYQENEIPVVHASLALTFLVVAHTPGFIA